MLLPVLNVRKGLWFVRHNKQSGLGLVTEPTECLGIRKNAVYFKSPHTGKSQSCTLSKIAFVSDSLEDVTEIYNANLRQFEEYEKLRFQHVQAAEQETAEIVTSKLIHENTRNSVIASFTYIPPSGAVQRYVTTKIPNSTRKWLLRIYSGMELAHVIRLPDVDGSDDINLIYSRQTALRAAGHDIRLFNRDFKPEPQVPPPVPPQLNTSPEIPE